VTIIEILSGSVPADGLRSVESADGMPTIYVASEQLVATCLALRDEPSLRFAFLADMTAVDYKPRTPRFEVIYLLACIGVGGFGDTPRRLRLKVQVAEAAKVPTVSAVWPAANWAEREIYDLFGIEFEDHPDLRRILMPDDWEGHPLRKDYPVQIRQAVKTYEPLQVSEEQFLANIEGARKH
jgi:NADH-quinone oxidoreductase subunit C